MIDHYLKTIDQIEQVLESKKVTGISISRNAVFPFIVFFLVSEVNSGRRQYGSPVGPKLVFE